MKSGLFIFFLLTAMQITMAAGPETEPFQSEKFDKVYYVSALSGQDVPSGGTLQNPWKSLPYAISQISSSHKNDKTAVLIARGEYPLKAQFLKENLALFGGFDTEFKNRDIFQHQTILDGQGTDRILIMAEGTKIDGLVIRKGRIRDKGGAIFCEGVACEMTNTIFYNNSTLSPQPWNPKHWHEIANDGGAIYCQNGATVVIKNNLFYHNTTENGRGAAIALNDHCKGIISGNVFLNNTTGLNDPQRSSDGGAVSVFDWSSPVIEKNVFLGNRALNNNDGGALFVALWSSPVIKQNIFVNNECGDDAGALFIGGQEHRYDQPLDPLPDAEDFFVNVSGNFFIGNRNPSNNSGAMRMTMESRGRFENNVVALNNGIYFQRSEVEVVNNTILDNFLFIETKEGLKKGKIINNIILGKYDQQVDALVSKNLLLFPIGGNNLKAEPLFRDDWIEINPEKVSFDPTRKITEIYTSLAKFPPGALVNRIVRAGAKWSVVKSNSEKVLQLWGDLSGEVEFLILPTYHLREGSPGIDQGDPQFAPASDVDGDPRPMGKQVDIGADEYTLP